MILEVIHAMLLNSSSHPLLLAFDLDNDVSVNKINYRTKKAKADINASSDFGPMLPAMGPQRYQDPCGARIREKSRATGTTPM